MNILLPVGAGVAALLTVAMFAGTDWDLPPIDAEQTGFRGTAMMQMGDVERLEAYVEQNQAPPPPWELDTSGPKAGEVYENVPLLGDLGLDQFTRLMTAMTEWIAPVEQGCNYCHNPENLASDEVYTKVIARHMIEMTWAINENWTDHVAETGVTCYTCHRGNAVPEYIWFNEEEPGPSPGMVGYTAGQNTVAIGSTSLHTDPFSSLIGAEGNIRVEGPTALPTGHDVSIQDTERTYSLMIHMSESLGVNCTFCHNTREFADWTQSTPQRITAWHGIQMVRDLNTTHLDPLQDQFPAERLGPLGDVAKVNCATCHQGVNKPLMGVSMTEDYPSLQATVAPYVAPPPPPPPPVETEATPSDTEGTDEPTTAE